MTYRIKAMQDTVDKIAALFETMGFAPVAGRMVGHLLICDPPHQSSAQLAVAVHASRSAISTHSRALMLAGLVERVRFPGDRAAYFRIVDDCWAKLLETERARTAQLRRLGDEALGYLEEGGAPEAQRARMRQLRDFSAFWEVELPAMIQRWHDRRGSTP